MENLNPDEVASTSSAGSSSEKPKSFGSKRPNASSKVRLPPSGSTKGKSTENLKKFINQQRQNKKQSAPSEKSGGDTVDNGLFEKAFAGMSLLRKGTGIIYDEEFDKHSCTWDEKYPECPNRCVAILDRITELKLIDRCVRLPSMKATPELITKLHTNVLHTQLQKLCENSSEKDMEEFASLFDSVYFNKNTFDCAVLAAGSAISLVENVCKGVIQNGMAIIRPPGHHAMNNEYCGYCFFNNVAVAAKNALDENLTKKILIVDFDVHHGQATQQMFYDSESVLYFSIHRYEHGDFWPNLRESNYDYIGTGKGTGYNINFPLNEIDLGDDNYFHIINQILLPVAYEYQPELIIFSAGYDACIGCPEGRMDVSPKFYGHLVNLLSGLACGKMAVCLEGGYFLPSLAEGAAMTLKALLGDSIPSLEPLKKAHPTVIETLDKLRNILSNYWNCFGNDNYNSNPNDVIKYIGVPLTPPYPTRTCYLGNTEEQFKMYSDIMVKHKKENELQSTEQGVACCYDSIMLKHCSDIVAVDSPERLSRIYESYMEYGLGMRCINIEQETVDLEILQKVHGKDYICNLLMQNFDKIIGGCTDLYFNEFTLKAVTAAITCLISLVDYVIKNKARNGAALIRPPGHHAEKETPMGFCYCNNVAVAAQYIMDKYEKNRILIIDFDIHHGNGTQKIFYDNDKVLYISIHKYNNGRFFPVGKAGNYTNCGKGKGLGYNVNIPLTNDTHYDVDYISIFHRIVLPIAYSFAPQIILVSAGFDAGIYDYLGNYMITPECYAHFISLLLPLAEGKIILALEGGYNPTTSKLAMCMCIKKLLNDPLPMLDLSRKVNSNCYKVIEKVLEIQSKYWPALITSNKRNVMENLNEKMTNM